MADPLVESEAVVVGRHDHPDVLAGERLTLQVVTPKGSLLARPVDEVVAPGVLGEMGVLPAHVPFLGALRAGVLTVRDGSQRQIFAVGPGYLQVGAANRVKILVDMAEAAGSIDADRARRDAEAANAALKDLGEAPARAVEQAKLDWAQARMDAAKAVP